MKNRKGILRILVSPPAADIGSPAAGVFLPGGRRPIIPIFRHSINPVVSPANLGTKIVVDPVNHFFRSR